MAVNRLVKETALEDPLSMEQRHVRAGRERVTRQVDLIARLARNGHLSMLPNAEAFLVELERSQALSEERLGQWTQQALKNDAPG